MNIQRTVYEKINSISPNVELAQVEVELAMDFSFIMKSANDALKTTSVATDKLNKTAAAYREAKKMYDQYSKTSEGYQKNLDAYYKEYDKKANDLGIDTKTTQFYKEYQDTLQKIQEIKSNVEQMKNIISESK
jgi:hypothetical protein